MATVVDDSKKGLPTTPWGYLPPTIRTLYVAGSQRTGGWLADAFAADSASDVALEEEIGMASGVARLRNEVFDAVLINHELPDLDALELLDALCAGGNENQPVVVLGCESEQEMLAVCYEAGADAYVCTGNATTRSLIWTVARAVERRRLLAENRRLNQADEHRREIEHDEATRLLKQQRRMIEAKAHDDVEAPSSTIQIPKPLVDHYRELLQTYIIMGSGNLAEELSRLVELLAAAGFTAHEAMHLHVVVLEEMIHGLGTRSARHVMNRADMLSLEMMINLADGYRSRYVRQVHPPRQQLLPGFE